MNRRGFLRSLAGVAAVHFLPPIGGWRSDTIVNPGMVFLMAELERIDQRLNTPLTRYEQEIIRLHELPLSNWLSRDHIVEWKCVR